MKTVSSLWDAYGNTGGHHIYNLLSQMYAHTYVCVCICAHVHAHTVRERDERPGIRLVKWEPWGRYVASRYSFCNVSARLRFKVRSF